VFDVLVPDPALRRGVRSTTPWFRDAATGQVSRCAQSFHYDASACVLRVTTEVHGMDGEGPTRVLTLEQRQLSPEETPRLLAEHGFAVSWRTATFAPPRDSLVDALALEPADVRSDAVAYVCAPLP
jgi:hypothetical protein